MTFDAPVQGPKKIAVIGAGISGMAAAYHLSPDHHVTLIEAEDRLGGHARTIVAGKNGDQPVDTGFIVFNHVNYPNLVRLFTELDVPTVKSDMSFAASIDGGRIEYGLRSVGAVFAQKANLVRPGFLRMLRDLMRFNAQAEKLATDSDITLGQLMDQMNMGPWFRDYYLTPVSGAIWSTPKEEIMDFPAQALVRFFRNHHLLSATGQHQWYTVQGGSVEYVTRLEAAMRARGVDIRLGHGVQAVLREAGGVQVQMEGHWETFDEVIFATHSDDSLAMLTDATPQEQAALGAVRYQPNDMVLHADARAMPQRRATWSSWNYTERPGFEGGPIDLTYWMNCLQPIPEEDPLFVTLNSRAPIDDKLIYDTKTFRHPVYDLPALAAQKTIAAMNGDNATWFCGAWMKNGFHEDGYGSAMDVVDGLRAPRNPGRCRMSDGVDHIQGKTFHGRRGAVENAFTYGIDYVMLDAEGPARGPAFFGRNRAGMFSLQDRDHGGAPKEGAGAPWAREVLAAHGLADVTDGKLMLLAQPRVLGHVFNPVSFWLCNDRQNRLRAVIAEVSNTFGDRHSYLCFHHDHRVISREDTLTATKIFHVSPFQPIDGGYTFRFDIRPDKIGIWIEFSTGNEGVLATLTGARVQLTNGSILRAALRRPLGSRRVLSLIHWQALKLWWKGADYRDRPEPPSEEVSR